MRVPACQLVRHLVVDVQQQGGAAVERDVGTCAEVCCTQLARDSKVDDGHRLAHRFQLIQGTAVVQRRTPAVYNDEAVLEFPRGV